jgi:hypothetical protein
MFLVELDRRIHALFGAKEPIADKENANPSTRVFGSERRKEAQKKKNQNSHICIIANRLRVVVVIIGVSVSFSSIPLATTKLDNFNLAC